MVYYGVSLASDDLGGDMYRDFVLTSLVEIPGNILVIELGNRFGRKPSTTWSMLIGALSCGAIAGKLKMLLSSLTEFFPLKIVTVLAERELK
eukprot:gene19277-21203_t